jgi:stringent starvation protein B
MLSTKPYLIRAIYDWCADSGFTPYLAVQVDARTRVPREFVRDGQIVLNISAEATHQLSLGNDEITFQTRFNGASFPVNVPVDTVVAIYARENGQGMAFDTAAAIQIEDDDSATPQTGEVVPGDTAAADAGSEDAVSADRGGAEVTSRRTGHLTRVK